MSSLQHPTAADRRSNFERSRGAAHRRELLVTETERTSFQDQDTTASRIGGALMSKLCNILCFNPSKAEPSNDHPPEVVYRSAGARSPSKAATRKNHETSRRTRRRSTSASKHRTIDKTGQKKTSGRASARPKNGPMYTSYEGSFSSEYRTATTASTFMTTDNTSMTRRARDFHFVHDD